jgi:hypothetical protein
LAIRSPCAGHGVGALLAWDWPHQGSDYAAEVGDRVLDDTHIGGGPDGAGLVHETVQSRHDHDVLLAAISLLAAGLSRRGHLAHGVMRTPAATCVMAFLCRRRQFGELLSDVKRAAGPVLALLNQAFAMLATAYAAERHQLDVHVPVDSVTALATVDPTHSSAVLLPHQHGVRPLQPARETARRASPPLPPSAWLTAGSSLAGGVGAAVFTACYPGTAAALPLHLLALSGAAPASLPAALLGTHALAPRLHPVAGADAWVAHVVRRAGPTLLAQATVHAATLRFDAGER